MTFTSRSALSASISGTTRAMQERSGSSACSEHTVLALDRITFCSTSIFSLYWSATWHCFSSQSTSGQSVSFKLWSKMRARDLASSSPSENICFCFIR